MYAITFTIYNLAFWVSTVFGFCAGVQIARYYTRKSAEQKEQRWLEGYDE